MIIGLEGPEGAGKSAAMSFFGLMYASVDRPVFCFPGYKVVFRGKTISQELKNEEWMLQDDDFRKKVAGGIILADEIDKYFNKYTPSSVFSRLFTSLLTQRRKDDFSLAYSTQSSERLLSLNVAFSAHVKADCFDCYWTPWGKANHLQRGELSRISMYDNKGFFTGYPGTPIGTIILQTKKLWPCFESYAFTPPWAQFTKAHVNTPEVDINFGEQKPQRGKKLKLAKEAVS